MTLKKLLIIASVSLIAGCGEAPVKGSVSDGQQVTVDNQIIKGEVIYRERKLLPPGVTLKVTLEDVSKMDVASKVIAQTTTQIEGAPPYSFLLDYNKALIDSKMRYSVRAKLLLKEKLLFTSTEQLDPFKTPNENHQIILTMVQRTQPAVNHQPETGLAVVSVNPLAELTNTYWKLTYVADKAVEMSEKQGKEAYLQLQPDGTAKGFSGCNMFNGNYQHKGNNLSFGPMMSTKKACMAGMDTESQFMSVLHEVNYFSIHKEILSVLNDKKKKIAEFKAIYF